MTRLYTLWRDRRAAALIEFAIVLPVLLMLFVGGYQLSDALTAQRKVTIMTRAVGDLTSQYRTLRTAELDGLMAASTQILTPYATEPVRLRVTQITVESDGKVFRVDWSRARNAGPIPEGRYWAWAIPPAYRRPNMVFILSQSAYRYDSVLPNYFDRITFSDALWLLPRRSATITLT
ncbi:TadE/TadG family type IV pilus assembly protein [Sphingomonas sp. SAFR-052]|uniref:TadE/TadG family type IV pilus assembly protein n=1 Tax=Sphingomonas sp. SAFR-052 TaxID=3436867 RepID=UPI003F7FD273